MHSQTCHTTQVYICQIKFWKVAHENEFAVQIFASLQAMTVSDTELLVQRWNVLLHVRFLEVSNLSQVVAG